MSEFWVVVLLITATVLAAALTPWLGAHPG